MVRETDILQMIQERCQGCADHVLLGPGDDLAAILLSTPELLLGVDQVVDGLHVDTSRVPWGAVARKAVCRSLSDIAAMGGTPQAILAAVVLPSSTTDEQVDALCEGLRITGETYGAPLVGGDIAIHRRSEAPLTITVTVVASPTPPGRVTRSGAVQGDLICVTGCLGGTRLPDESGHHLTFVPRLEAGHLLRKSLQHDLHAMMDLSDGLVRDGERFAVASDLGIRIELETLPLGTSEQGRLDCEPMDALADGEDYELMIAIPESSLSKAKQVLQDIDCPLTAIGSVNSRHSQAKTFEVVNIQGSVIDCDGLGWEHEG